MNPRLQDALDALAAAAGRVAGYLRARRGWVEGLVLTVCALVALAAWGFSSHQRAAAMTARAVELERRSQSVRSIVAEYAAPDSVERDGWRTSELALASLASQAPDPLAVSRLVALRAEESGLSSVRIRLVGADTALAFPVASVGSWVMEPGERGVGLDFVGRWDQVIGLVGSLPPQVDVASLQLNAGAGGLVRTRLVLVTRHLRRPG